MSESQTAGTSSDTGTLTVNDDSISIGTTSPPKPKSSAETEKTENEEHMIPKSRLDQQIARTKKAEAELDALAKAKEKAEKEKLAEQGKYQELYEKATAAEAKSAADLELYRLDAIKHSVASEAGYPDLWNRIQGDSEETLAADMAALVEVLPPSKPPNLAAGTGSGKRSGESEPERKSAEERAYIASQLGVRVQDLPDTV